jgi:hypothetical protein
MSSTRIVCGLNERHDAFEVVPTPRLALPNRAEDVSGRRVIPMLSTVRPLGQALADFAAAPTARDRVADCSEDGSTFDGAL